MLLRALLLLVLLAGCSPSFKADKHLRKAKKHILKAESFGATWSTDTIYKEIAVIRPEVRHDTVIRVLNGDTVVLEKDRLKIKILRLPGDSIFVQGECKADTVKIEVPVVVNKEIKCPPDKWKIPAFVFGGIIVLFIAALLFMLNRRN